MAETLTNSFRFKDTKISYDFSTLEGCCGIVVISALAVPQTLEISKQEKKDFYSLLDEVILGRVVNTYRFSSAIITDVVPRRIKNKDGAFWALRAPHNDIVNLYGYAKWAKWRNVKKVYNKKTGNTVAVFIKEY